MRPASLVASCSQIANVGPKEELCTKGVLFSHLCICIFCIICILFSHLHAYVFVFVSVYMFVYLCTIIFVFFIICIRFSHVHKYDLYSSTLCQFAACTLGHYLVVIREDLPIWQYELT